MNDSACAPRATNTLHNELDDIIVAVSDLQNLLYIQQLVLSERSEHSTQRDALFTLHYSLQDRLNALETSCGRFSDVYFNGKAAGRAKEKAQSGIVYPRLQQKDARPD